MNPNLEEQQLQQDNKRRRLNDMQEVYEYLHEYNKVGKSLFSPKRNSRKRNRSPTVTISSSSSECSNAFISTSNMPKDDNSSRNKKPAKRRKKYFHKNMHRRRSPGKSPDSTHKKCISETDLRRMHEKSMKQMSLRIKRENIEENSTVEINNKTLTERVALTEKDESVREIKREIKVEEKPSMINETHENETVHETLSAKWSVILRDGLLEDIKDELTSGYRLTKNYEFLKAPRLNRDLELTLNDKYIKSDRRQVSTQNRVASAMVAIDKVLSLVLNRDDDSDFIADTVEILVDTGTMLAGVHHDLTMKRRHDVITSFDIGDVTDLGCVKNDLFGEQFLLILKSAQTLIKREQTNTVEPTRVETINVTKTAEKINDVATKLNEKIDNCVKKTEQITNNVATRSEEKKSNALEDSGKKKNDAKDTVEKIDNSEGKKNLEEKSNAVEDSGKKKDHANDTVEKIDNSEGKKNLEEKSCAQDENSEEKKNNDKKDTSSVPKDSSKILQTVVNDNNARKSNEDIVVDLTNLSVRCMHQITLVYEKRIADLSQTQDVKCQPRIKVYSYDTWTGEKFDIFESVCVYLGTPKQYGMVIIGDETSFCMVQKDSATSVPFPGFREALKRKYVSEGYTEDDAEKLAHALADSTMKGYDKTVRHWWEFCSKNDINVFQGTVQNVVQFFIAHESIIATDNNLAKWRSALGEFSIEDLGKSKIITNYVKSFKNRRN